MKPLTRLVAVCMLTVLMRPAVAHDTNLLHMVGGTTIVNPDFDLQSGDELKLDMGSTILVKAESVTPTGNALDVLLIGPSVGGYVMISGRAEGNAIVTMESNGLSKSITIVVSRHRFSRKDTTKYAQLLTQLLADRYSDIVVTVRGKDTIVLSGTYKAAWRGRTVSPGRIAPPTNDSDPISFARTVVPDGISLVDNLDRSKQPEEPKIRLIN